MSEAEPQPQPSVPARPVPTGPLSLRISDAERHQVAELLRDAAGDGRLTMEELDERLETVYRAKTYAELVPVAADLPGARDRLPMAATAEFDSKTVSQAPARQLGRPGAHTSGGAVAIFGGSDRSGVWTVSESFTALAVMGGVSLDFREATFTAAETTVYANCLMGGIDITVPDDIIVRVAGIPFMGGFDGPKGGSTRNDLGPDTPVLLIKGIAIMGGVDVKVKARKSKGAADDE